MAVNRARLQHLQKWVHGRGATEQSWREAQGPDRVSELSDELNQLLDNDRLAETLAAEQAKQKKRSDALANFDSKVFSKGTRLQQIEAKRKITRAGNAKKHQAQVDKETATRKASFQKIYEAEGGTKANFETAWQKYNTKVVQERIDEKYKRAYKPSF